MQPIGVMRFSALLVASAFLAACQPTAVGDDGPSGADAPLSSAGDALAGYACSTAAAQVAACEGSAQLPSGECANEQAGAAQVVSSLDCQSIQQPGDPGVGELICIALVIPLTITNVQPGGLCCFPYQCKDSAKNTCSGHRCVAKLSTGGKCGTDNALCAGSLTCLPSGRCGAAGGAGAACAERSDCASSLTCDKSGRCAVPLADGASCTNDEECQHRCVNGTCAPASEAGGACDESSDCAAFLACIDGACGKPTVGSACTTMRECMFADTPMLQCQFGACAPRSARGERCDRAAPFPCATFGDICFEETCMVARKKDETCARSTDCAHGRCANGVCTQ